MNNVLKNSEKKSTKWYVNPIFVVLLCIILLVLPLILRNFVAFGEDFYLYKRISSIKSDDLSYGGRDFLYNPGNVFVFSLIDSYFLSIILGILSLVLFYNILKKFDVDENTVILSCFLLIISQAFMYTFSTFREFTLPVFLILLGAFIFVQKKFYWISYLIFALIPFFGLISSIVLTFLVFVYCLKFKRIKDFFIVLFIILVILSYIYIPIIKIHGIPQVLTFNVNALKGIIFEFGSDNGISIFIVILMLVGLLKLWEQKYKNIAIYVIFFLFIFSLLFSLDFIFYFIFFISFLGALGINKLMKRKWESNLVKNLTLVFFILGLVFSSFAFLVYERNSEPSKELLMSLDFLNRGSDNNDVVLSHYKYGIFINSVANKKNVMDSRFLYAPNVNERYQDLDSLFYTRDLEKSLEILKKYNVRYILITSDMKNGLVWKTSNEGLLYLLVNNPKVFSKAYDNDKVEIWELK
jgi:hypothetical protein